VNAFWAGLIALVIAGYVVVQRDVRKVRKILEFLAAERDGKIRNVFGSYPQLRFPHDGVTMLVSAMSGSSGGTTGSHSSPHTFAQCYLSSVPEALFFRIRSKSTQTAGERLFGLKDKQLGDTAFDERFVIETQDTARLNELLTQDLRRRIVDLEAERGVQVSLQKVKYFNGKAWVEEPRLNVAIDMISTERQDYAALIDAVLSLYDRIKEITKDNV
jgi:hypothetical protein